MRSKIAVPLRRSVFSVIVFILKVYPQIVTVHHVNLIHVFIVEGRIVDVPVNIKDKSPCPAELYVGIPEFVLCVD